MMRHIFRPSGRVFLSALFAFVSAFILAATAQTAVAATHAVLGCDTTVWNAMTAKAQAQVAYDAAVTDELINKPDSVLTLTCFSDAAGVSAKLGGAIFSGDFTQQLNTIVPVTGNGTYNCTAIGDLENAIINHGVDAGAPYATFNDLMTGTAPTSGNNIATGADFTAGWKAASTAKVFSNLNTAISKFPKQTPLNFSGAKSSCDVLKDANIVSSCP